MILRVQRVTTKIKDVAAKLVEPYEIGQVVSDALNVPFGPTVKATLN
jgi:hypothetical protein